ncbi:MAG: bifunctional glutamate N-acetyltransferase/amino-acid acetyltransferase ArgJ [Desulfobacteraceae bacterium]
MKGFKFNGIQAGIKKHGGRDLGIIFSEKPASAAAVFTKNRVAAAPVLLGRDRIRQGICQAVIVNSGNANCCTGRQGLHDAVHSAGMAADLMNIPEEFTMVSSTGVIGAPMPMGRIEAALPGLIETMKPDRAEYFAESILTTDKQIKIETRKGEIRGKTFTITGIAKGSGMIKPDMATMLAFVMTDLDVFSDDLNTVLKKSCSRSFNRITVDGDTSTNDTVLCLANGMSDAAVEQDGDLILFQTVFDDVLFELSKKIVRDGEGAKKLARITVKGAETPDDAFRAAETVATSNLVKTALTGEDPNWGRILAAAGRSGARVAPEKIDLQIGDVLLVRKGEWLGKASETKASAIMRTAEFDITLDLNLGECEDFFLFCDLTREYVDINADYRT